MAMIVIRIVLICLISSIITEAKPVSNADLICLKPFDFIKNLVKELVADQKIELLCQLGKNLEGLVGEIKSEEDDQNLKLALDFWKERTDKLQNFEYLCLMRRAISSRKLCGEYIVEMFSVQIVGFKI